MESVPSISLEESVKGWLSESQTSPAGNKPASRGEEDPHDSGLATSLFECCSQVLAKVIEALRGRPWFKGQLQAHTRDLCAKFSLFGDSFGYGKLESVIGVDDEIRSLVLRSLCDIASLLIQSERQDDSLTIFNDRSAPPLAAYKEVVGSLKILKARAESVIESESSDSDDSNEDVGSASDGEGGSDRPSQQFQKRFVRPLAHSTELLLELCPTLEETYALHHRTVYSKPPLEPKLTVTISALPYVRNIRDKFPFVKEGLAERLGEANWQRHEKIRATESGEAVFIEEQAKSVFHPVSLFKDSALGSSLPTQSVLAPSIASHSSFLSSNANKSEGAKRRVPNIPKGFEYGTPFVCLFCKSRVDVPNRIAWKMHVFKDLQAYICTSPSCPNALTTFPTRKSWFEHEESHHLYAKCYRCRTCSDEFVSEMPLLYHVERFHGASTANERIRESILLSSTVTSPEPPKDLDCQLCRQRGFSSTRQYMTHVGRHLEEIALFALPQTADSDDDEDVNDGSSSSAERSSGASIKPRGSVSKGSGVPTNLRVSSHATSLSSSSSSRAERYIINGICNHPQSHPQGRQQSHNALIKCEKCHTRQHFESYSPSIPQAAYSPNMLQPYNPSVSASYSPNTSQSYLPAYSISPINNTTLTPPILPPAASGLSPYSDRRTSPLMQSPLPPVFMGPGSIPPPPSITRQGVTAELEPKTVDRREKPQCWDHGCNGREFSTFSNLLRHQREKSGSAAKSYCPHCGAEFTRTTARDGHMEHGKCKGRRSSTATGVSQQSSFMRSNTLHEDEDQSITRQRVTAELEPKTVDRREKPQCWDHGCNGREFSTFSKLLRHQREKLGSAAKSYCPNCGAEFTRTTARNGHIEHGKCKGRRSSTATGVAWNILEGEKNMNETVDRRS